MAVNTARSTSAALPRARVTSLDSGGRSKRDSERERGSAHQLTKTLESSKSSKCNLKQTTPLVSKPHKVGKYSFSLLSPSQDCQSTNYASIMLRLPIKKKKKFPLRINDRHDPTPDPCRVTAKAKVFFSLKWQMKEEEQKSFKKKVCMVPLRWNHPRTLQKENRNRQDTSC